MAATCFCERLHLGERDLLAGLGGGLDQAGVLQRQEALRHDDVEGQRGDEGGGRDEQRHGPALEHPGEAAPVEVQEPVQDAIRRAHEEAGWGILAGAQEPAAHHRRQRQRDDGRGDDRDRERQRELAEEAADDAGHEEQRDEDGDERDGERDDGEADLARTLEGGGEGRVARLDVARDVLDHHDGVVDHEAGADRERHQGEIVEAEAREPHDPEGGDQREGQGHAGDEGGPGRAQEEQNDEHDQPTLSTRVSWTSWTEARIVPVRSLTTESVTPSGMPRCSLGRIERMPSTVSMMLAPGWRCTSMTTAGLP